MTPFESPLQVASNTFAHSPRRLRLFTTLAPLLTAVPLLAGNAALNPGAWPQWRGPTRDGQVRDVNWPDQLGTNQLRQSWRVELGPSYSGPIVASDRVFTTETKDKKVEAVTAFDRKTGKLIWRSQWDGALSVPFFAKSNGDWIRSTPALDGDRLYVAGMRDVLVCLDAGDGRQIWRKDFVQELGAPLPDFGFVSSPLVEGDSVYVQAAASFLRLNKTTGRIVWRTLEDQGGMWGSVFSSPIFAELPTSTNWGCYDCECNPEETSSARAGCGKIARPVRGGAGRGTGTTDNCGRFKVHPPPLPTLPGRSPRGGSERTPRRWRGPRPEVSDRTAGDPIRTCPNDGPVPRSRPGCAFGQCRVRRHKQGGAPRIGPEHRVQPDWCVHHGA